MTREMPPLPSVASRPRTSGAPWRILLLVLVALPCSGCSIFEDEFTWLDRAAPSTQQAPDAAQSGLEAGH